jgi:Alpha/beta hydrolase domain
MLAGTRFVKRVSSIGVVAVLALLASSCVFGPITGPGETSLTTGFDLGTVGYKRTEFFQAGQASSYTPTAPLGTDGKWQVAPASTKAPFQTRFIVDTPTDPFKFNGSVIVEWLNVSTGGDIGTDWVMAHNEFYRQGYAYVGVSAQFVGVENMKTQRPDRYSKLSHPGDSYSYDIFSKVGQALHEESNRLFDGLSPQRFIATGESQSAGRLVTYINAVHPLVHVFDGFMVHSRGAGGSPLSQDPQPSVSVPSPAPIRDDLDEPVMVVQAEGDVIGSNLGARQPDTPKFREWEIAGTSHADVYTVAVGNGDNGDGQGAVRMLGFMRNPLNAGCELPINAGPHHWVLQAAFHHLERWVRDGTPPPSAPQLQLASTTPVVFLRDVYGNALGGVRSPQVDVPIATLSANNGGGNTFCRLFGSTTPFSTQQLTALYPTHDDFVNQWRTSLWLNTFNGYILPEDASELYDAAVGTTIPN